MTHLGLTQRNTDGIIKFFQFNCVEASQIQIGDLYRGSRASFGSDNMFYLIILNCHTLSKEFGNALSLENLTSVSVANMACSVQAFTAWRSSALALACRAAEHQKLTVLTMYIKVS
jgi:hypothetical protein